MSPPAGRRLPLARCVAGGERAEDVIVAVAALGIIVLPLSEVVLRRWFNTGVPGSASFTHHLTMVVGLMGAAVAAREGKLLSLATGTLLPAGRARNAAAIGAALVGALVAVVLAVAGGRLLQVHYEAGKTIALGVPVWTADLAFPVAFGLIALRLVWRSASSPLGRLVAALGIAAGIGLASAPEQIAGMAWWPGIAILIGAAMLGMPIFALLGGSAVLLFLVQGDSAANVAIGGYDQLTSNDLPAIPLFTLTGLLLAEGQASARLIRVFRAVFGWAPGGTAVVATTLCAFFTVFTGGSGVTILALGGVLLPALLAEGYRERFSLGLLTASGSIGLLFPPCLPLILYGIVAGVAIGDLFIGGLLPGLLMLGVLAALGIREGIVAGSRRTPFEAREAALALWGAKWELLMPVVIVASLAGGATTVQSSALVAFSAIIVQRYIHRDLPTAAELVRVFRDAISLAGGVLIILAVAVGLTTYLIDAEVPGALVDWTRSHVQSRAMFLLGLNVFLLLVGCLMDIFSAIVVVVPLIVPIAAAFGVNPVHLGIIFVANLELGYLTPPVGLNLFLASYRFKKPVWEIARATLPMLGVLAVAVLLITYVPWLTTGVIALLNRQ
jgi:tripartite ATP-independent transporter DctM subunit